ncbi:hypothetical protein [Corallincola spongiicola]|uniref:DUF4194 domain-containing protein n=1 Tax=Corallincola spongiicola TaxID=2520508 RepID=A0ABY1WT18_9GAMM|nr:hypothetical protein [Corallincola spongiicola]TAA47862.1 hypothetical protein EXY25_01025 [Corallincola spongiicola]
MLSNMGHVIERLLQGAFICRTSDEEGWRLLKDPARREQVEQHLNVLNRTLSECGAGSDSEVFFCGYRQLGDDERKVVAQQFKDIVNGLIPLTQWLMLVQEAEGKDAPLSEGSPVRLTELQSTIEDTPAFREQLDKLSKFRLFGSQSTQVDGQIKQIFKRLVELGYLLRPNPEKQYYIATGKIDYLYEVIRFINETEALDLEAHAEAATAQGSLL